MPNNKYILFISFTILSIIVIKNTYCAVITNDIISDFSSTSFLRPPQNKCDECHRKLGTRMDFPELAKKGIIETLKDGLGNIFFRLDDRKVISHEEKERLYQNSQISILLNKLHEIFSSLDESKSVLTLELAPASLEWCNCAGCPKNARIYFLLKFLNEVCKKFNPTEISELVITSLGAGGLLQELFCTVGLAFLDYKKIKLNLIDPLYTTENSKEKKPRLGHGKPTNVNLANESLSI